MVIDNEEEVVADLTGPDPGVMYVLGIAHTVGKETVLICPEDSRHLVDMPKTHTIEYEDRYSGRIEASEYAFGKLKGLLAPLDLN